MGYAVDPVMDPKYGMSTILLVMPMVLAVALMQRVSDKQIQDCKTTKSEYVVAIETIERVAKHAMTVSEAPSTSEAPSDIAPKTTDCKACQ